MPADSISEQIARTESQIDSYNAAVEELQEKIARLKETKPVVARIKKEIKEQKTDTDANLIMAEGWWGDRYRAYYELAGEGLLEPYGTYHREVDEILDSINDAITRMENEILETKGIIGKLRALCNSLWNELRNAFN